MKIGPRVHGDASLQIRFCQGVPDRIKQDVREITDLQVLEKSRRMGLATDLMEEVCKEADKFKVILVLRPGRFGEGPGPNDRELCEWYSTTFNFHPIQTEPLLLARMFDLFPQTPVAKEVSRIITEF